MELSKNSSGLGFSVQGGAGGGAADPVSCIPRIKRVFLVGPAAQSGQIQVGDVILAVGGQSVRALSFSVS